MLACGNGDGEERRRESHGMWTVECLRRRLLAERVASRVAKQDADLMGKKLIELERQLRTETEAMNKAEKRLKLLLQTMESMKLSPIQQRRHSRLLEDSEGSSVPSTPSSSGVKEAKEEEKQSKEMLEATDSALTSQNLRNGEHKMGDSRRKIPATGDSLWSDTAGCFSVDKDKYPKETREGDADGTEELMINDLKREDLIKPKYFVPKCGNNTSIRCEI